MLMEEEVIDASSSMDESKKDSESSFGSDQNSSGVSPAGTQKAGKGNIKIRHEDSETVQKSPDNNWGFDEDESPEISQIQDDSAEPSVDPINVSRNDGIQKQKTTAVSPNPNGQIHSLDVKALDNSDLQVSGQKFSGTGEMAFE